MTIKEEIREKISCPQIGDDHYGMWGDLPLKQRLEIKKLIDYCDSLELGAKKWAQHTEKMSRNLGNNQMTAEQRSEAARRAVQARWARRKNES